MDPYEFKNELGITLKRAPMPTTADEAVALINTSFEQVLDKVAPKLKKHSKYQGSERVHKVKSVKITESIRRKRRFERKYHKNKTEENAMQYKKQSNSFLRYCKKRTKQLFLY